MFCDGGDGDGGRGRGRVMPRYLSYVEKVRLSADCVCV